jgi:Tol biopolymer transport system component
MGKQLWLMHPDGSNAVGLTEDADIHYNNPSWSPDGKHLVVQGFNQLAAESEPGLWLVDVADGGITELITPGIQPTWLP